MEIPAEPCPEEISHLVAVWNKAGYSLCSAIDLCLDQGQPTRFDVLHDPPGGTEAGVVSLPGG